MRNYAIFLLLFSQLSSSCITKVDAHRIGYIRFEDTDSPPKKSKVAVEETSCHWIHNDYYNGVIDDLKKEGYVAISNAILERKSYFFVVSLSAHGFIDCYTMKGKGILK